MPGDSPCLVVCSLIATLSCVGADLDWAARAVPATGLEVGTTEPEPSIIHDGRRISLFTGFPLAICDPASAPDRPTGVRLCPGDQVSLRPRDPTHS